MNSLAIEAEIVRGGETRFWEDVKIGEKCQPIVRGPLTIADMIAWLMGKIGPHLAIGASYVIAAGFVFVMGTSIHNVALLSICVLGAGFFNSGAQTATNALSSSFYPTQARATGLGAMQGVGRCGAILGAYIGGPLLAMGYNFQTIIEGLAVPALVAGMAMGLKGLYYARKGSGGQGSAIAEPAGGVA